MAAVDHRLNRPPMNAGDAMAVLNHIGCNLGGIAEHATVIAVITLPDGTMLRTDKITFGYSSRNVAIFVDASAGDQKELDPQKQ